MMQCVGVHWDRPHLVPLPSVPRPSVVRVVGQRDVELSRVFFPAQHPLLLGLRPHTASF